MIIQFWLYGNDITGVLQNVVWSLGTSNLCKKWIFLGKFFLKY